MMRYLKCLGLGLLASSSAAGMAYVITKNSDAAALTGLFGMMASCLVAMTLLYCDEAEGEDDEY